MWAIRTVERMMGVTQIIPSSQGWTDGDNDVVVSDNEYKGSKVTRP